MGRTGNLREYLSDISRTISSSGSGGGESKDVFDAFKSYVTNTDNIDSITLVDGNGTTGNIPFTSIIDNTIEEPTFDGLLSVTIHYKNGKELIGELSREDIIFIETPQNMWGIGIDMESSNEFILACYEHEQSSIEDNILWQITIITQEDEPMHDDA